MRKPVHRIARPAAGALALCFLLQSSCVTAGRRTSDSLLTPEHRAWIAKRVSQFRGHPIPESAPFDLKSRQEVAAIFQREASNALSDKEITRRLRADRALGLLPADVPIDGAASRPFTRADFGVAGTFDPKTGKIIVVNDLEGGPFSELTLAHEFAHQLDDVRHDLYQMALDARGNSDRALAVQSLIEGSAMAVQLDFALSENYEDATGTLGRLSVSRTLDDLESDFGLLARVARSRNPRAMELLQATPVYLRERLVFPYGRGLEFARALRVRRGTAAMDDAFDRPPVSTEQILHPEKYYDWREDPDALALDTSWLAGAALVQEDTLGELGTRQMLEQYIQQKDAWHAAEGWGGDRYQILQIDGRDVLLWLTEWDSELDAREFAKSVDLYYANRYSTRGNWMSELASDDLARTDGRFIQIRRKGSTVAIADGVPANGAWAEQLLNSSKITKATVNRPKRSLLGAIASPFVGVDHYDEGGGFNLLGGILVSESHRKESNNFSLFGGLLLDVQGSRDGSRVSLLFGLISWRTAPREKLKKWRVGVSAIAGDEDTQSWSVLPIVNAPAGSSAPGSSTFRTGIVNLKDLYDVKFAADGSAASAGKIGGETSLLLGLSGRGYVDRTYPDGTPYVKNNWWGPFEMGFSTVSEKKGPFAPLPEGAESQPASQPADKLRFRPGDVELYTRSQSFGELLFSYEFNALERENKTVADVTNWSVLGGLLAAGGSKGDDWLFRTPLAGWGKLQGQSYLLFLWGLIAIPVSGAPTEEK